MKLLVPLSVWSLLALTGPRLASAQPAPSPTPTAAPTPTAGTPPAPEAADSPPPPPAPEAAPPAPMAPAALPPPPPAANPTLAKGVEWTSLKLLRAKGVISEAEYTSALKDMGETVGAGDANTLVVSKLKLTLFGFAQADFEWNSTQSCQEFCSNFLIQKEGTYRGDHSRMVFSPRDTRFGIRFAAPEDHGIRASGLIETDFFGPTTTSEQGTWSNPVLRIRHAYLKLETPVVDILLGQTFNLFGWGSAYLVTGAQEPGLPGQMYQRTSQLRISKTIKTKAGVTLDLAIAAERPPQMDSGLPEGVAGFKLSVDKWTGYHTLYLSASLAQPASISVTGDLRGFRIAEFSSAPKEARFRTGGGIAVNAFLPIIGATKASHDNALSISGEFVTGKGISDMYTALGGAGTVNAPLPPAMPGGPALTYAPNFDAGLAAYDATGHLELIQWTSYMIGAEFYPGGVGGRLGLFANYGHMQSSNTDKFAGANTRESEDFLGVGLFFDPTKQTRIGIDYGLYSDHYVDGSDATNHSGLMSAWLFF